MNIALFRCKWRKHKIICEVEKYKTLLFDRFSYMLKLTSHPFWRFINYWHRIYCRVQEGIDWINFPKGRYEVSYSTCENLSNLHSRMILCFLRLYLKNAASSYVRLYLLRVKDATVILSWQMGSVISLFLLYVIKNKILCY